MSYTTKTIAEVRTAVKAIFGPKNARVTKNGEVHVNGDLLGFVGQAELDEKIWHPDGSLNNGLNK